MATRLSPPTLSDSWFDALINKDKAVKFKEISLTLSLEIDTERASLKPDQFWATKPQIQLELTGVPDLSCKLPLLCTDISSQLSSFAIHTLSRKPIQSTEMTFQGMAGLPFTQDVSETLALEIARDVSSRIPENMPNREFMKNLAFQAALEGARAIIKVQLDV